MPLITLARLLTIAVCMTASLSIIALEKDGVAPDFDLSVLSDSSDDRIQLQSYRGQVVYVDFWASWCPPCRLSLPFLETLRAELAEQGFEVIAINVDKKPEDGLKFLERFPISYPVASDPEGKTPKAWQIKGMPTAYLLDREGTVQWVHVGFKESDKAKVRAHVEQVLSR